MGDSWGSAPASGRLAAGAEPGDVSEAGVSVPALDGDDDAGAPDRPVIDIRSPRSDAADDRPALDRLFEGEADPTLPDPSGTPGERPIVEAPDA